MGFVDLHTHSDASDGSFTPAQLVHLAKEAGLCAIALTDHDTTAGIADAIDAGKELGVEVVPGIEVSGNYEGHEIHILGLFINPDDPELKAFLKDMRSRRDRRNEEMFRRLAADGISFTDEELFGSNPQTVITRAHVARAMVQKGLCSSVNQAFKKYLEYGGRYCPPKEETEPESIVKILLKNGAFAALAHPFLYKLGDKQTKALITRLAEAGMQGLEVYHSSNYPLESRKLQKMAAGLKLLPTGGSDFHGSCKPDISIGTGRGGLRVPELLLEDIRRCACPKSQMEP